MDIYQAIQDSDKFRKIGTGKLLAAEYLSKDDGSLKKVWSHYNSLAYVLEGEKTWITQNSNYKAEVGSILFCQKGGHIAFNCAKGTTRVLLLFFPDEFIKEVLIEYPNIRPASEGEAGFPDFKVFKLHNDVLLEGLMKSVYAYFFDHNMKSSDLLKLKFQELIVQIITSGENADLAMYFRKAVDQKHNEIAQVMESNFLFNMKMEEFARLSGCSLSTFKREFSKIYGMPPGKWLKKKRLEHAYRRLKNTTENINEIAYITGFENPSHFIQAFKDTYGITPSGVRKKVPVQN